MCENNEWQRDRRDGAVWETVWWKEVSLIKQEDGVDSHRLIGFRKTEWFYILGNKACTYSELQDAIKSRSSTFTTLKQQQSGTDILLFFFFFFFKVTFCVWKVNRNEENIAMEVWLWNMTAWFWRKTNSFVNLIDTFRQSSLFSQLASSLEVVTIMED